MTSLVVTATSPAVGTIAIASLVATVASSAVAMASLVATVALSALAMASLVATALSSLSDIVIISVLWLIVTLFFNFLP